MIARAFAAVVAAAMLAAASPTGAQKLPAPAPQGSPTAAIEWVLADELPREARATIALIRKGGPFPYARDGAPFGNREAMLPRQKRGYYREYTVKTPGVRNRGARRIVAGAGGELYYTDDHYNRFRRVRE
jgi:ribonuclease T1